MRISNQIGLEKLNNMTFLRLADSSAGLFFMLPDTCCDSRNGDYSRDVMKEVIVCRNKISDVESRHINDKFVYMYKWYNFLHSHIAIMTLQRGNGICMKEAKYHDWWIVSRRL